ncbi:MAG: aminopeptidase N [Pseudomonadota bacterium]
MKSDTEPLIRLADYAPPPFLIDRVHLTVRLHPRATRVTARLHVRRNPAGDASADMLLDGVGLRLVSASIDGAAVPVAALTQTAAGLTVAASALPEDAFEWVAETEIAPEANTALEGLYMSKGMYCTQCEAQGFRKITYFPDRPDVMAVYTVRIESDLPVLLSNGNPVDKGPGWAEWHDPWPKPSYLFALVAGDLQCVADHFTTASGRGVDLQIWVRDGDQGKCAYALDALKRAMAWDERAYGREYDLDLFMIVAVDDFNMGAMENKGLNVFNSKYVLASPDTATDRDYEFIEGIIAHEYFHNWTGNRITCRDWFQLCLKEGLTVYRDQQFSADERSAPVKRIDDVIRLRAAQFREDAGPLAHPVRPDRYVEINNFYTATVYEKGAEVIGMLRTLVGADVYDRALTLYFDRHDGQACTIEDWLAVFEEASGRDLTQFKRWYTQAGTPEVAVAEAWQDGTYKLTFTQATPATPGQDEKAPQVIPLAMGLLAPDGSEILPTTLVELTEAQETLQFEGLAARPIPSLLRGFSAPVILARPASAADALVRLAHDTDPFNRWEAGRSLMREAVADCALGAGLPEPGLFAGLEAVLADAALDPAYKALVLSLPSLDDVMETVRGRAETADPEAAYAALAAVDTGLAQHLAPRLEADYAAHRVAGPYRPDAADAGRRALSGRLLGLLSRAEEGAASARAQFAAAGNMTEAMQALGLLVREGAAEDALAAFYRRWQADRLVIDKWFAVQISAAPPARAVEAAAALTGHPDFDARNPNRFRAVIGVLAMGNGAAFHRRDGAGYALVADHLIALDPINPQTTARIAGAFESWRQFDEHRQRQMLRALQRIADQPDLSRDTTEIVTRILEAAP